MPYNPGVQDRSGELLARGISGAGQGLARGLEKFLTERKERSQKASALRKALSVYDPDKKEDYNTMSLEDLEGSVAGLKMQQNARVDQARLTREAAEQDAATMHREYYKQQLSDRKRSADQDEQFRLLNGGELPAGFEGPPRPAAQDGQAMLGNAAKAGYGPREIAALAAGISHLRSLNPGAVEFVEDPTTGVRFARQGNSLLPSGVNPELADIGRTMGLLDEEGNPIGKYAVKTGKGVQVVGGQNEARDMRDTSASVAQLEGVLQGLDKQIQGYESRNAGIAGKQKGYEGLQPVAKEQLDELRARRERVKKHLDGLDGGGMTNDKGTNDKVLPGRGTMTKPKGSKPADTAKAEAIRAEFKAGKITKAEALKRLKEIGYGD